MMQLMETWLLADRNALKRCFGRNFRESALSTWPQLEAVPKAGVLEALQRATAECGRPYAKGTVSFELLAQADPALVEAACPHAKALFDRLRKF